MYLVSIVVFVLIVNFFRSFQFIMQTILRFSREEKNVRHNILFTFNNFFIFFLSACIKSIWYKSRNISGFSPYDKLLK